MLVLTLTDRESISILSLTGRASIEFGEFQTFFFLMTASLSQLSPFGGKIFRPCLDQVGAMSQDMLYLV